MIWSFLWRAALAAPAGAWLATWVAGFIMRLASVDPSTAYSVGTAAQVVGILLGLASAYLNAKDQHPPKPA